MAAAVVEMYVPLVSKGSGAPLVDPDLRRRLVLDAADRGVSLGDLVNSIVAARFEIPYETTPRHTTPSEIADHLRFQMPKALHRRVSARTRRPQSVNDAVRTTLSAHYGLPLPAKPKRTRRTVA